MVANEPIKIYRGDDTDAFGLRTLTIKITGDLPLEDARATFSLLSYSKAWTNAETKAGVLVMKLSSAETKPFPLGLALGTLRLYDGLRRLTVVNTIPFEITETVFGAPSQQYDLNVILSVDTEINIHLELSGDAWQTCGQNDEALEPRNPKVKRIVVPQLANVAALGNRFTLTDVKNLANTILNALKV